MTMGIFSDTQPYGRRFRFAAFPLKAATLLLLMALVITMTFHCDQIPFFYGSPTLEDPVAPPDTPLSYPATLSRTLMGPLAAFPDPLEPNQMQEIEHTLKNMLQNTDNSTNHPVLFVPGLMSSQLETKLSNRKKPHWWLPSWFCPKTTDSYQRVWFFQATFWTILPFVIDCYVETLLLQWDDGTNSTTHNIPGIDTRLVGTFDSVMELDPNTPIYRNYANWLTKYLGYQPDQQMIAQPFDWRVGPQTWKLPGREFDQMKTAIEKVVQKNQGKGVVALSISAGGPFFACFLNQHVHQEWKDQHIHAFFSVSGALSGSAIAPMQLLGLGHNSFLPSEIPKYITKAFGKVVQTSSSVSWLFPFEDSFHDAVITTPSRSYHAKELDQALQAAGQTKQAELYLANRPYFGGTQLVPGVPTYCLSGFGIPTLTGLQYNTDDMSDKPLVNLDDGDNCVPLESLRQCDAWVEQQKEAVHVHHYYNQTHAGLLYDPDVIQRFFQVVTEKDEELPYTRTKY